MAILGSLEMGSSGSASWFEGATPASMHYALSQDWTLTGWFKARDDSSTVALVEYASLASPTSNGNLMRVGVYRLGNGKIRAQYDRSTASLGYFIDFNTTIGSAPFFIGLSKNENFSGNTAMLSLVINDQHVSTSPLRACYNSDSTSGITARWVLGASRRWGNATGTSPAFATVGLRADDVAFYDEILSGQKLREVYRNGLRTFHEQRMFESNSHRVACRVSVEDGDGVLVDLTSLYGVNWVKAVDCGETVDEVMSRATVTLQAYAGTSLNLSPLSQTSALNLNAAASFEALLELRRRVLIEYAAVPNEWLIQGWEWEPIFDGFVDDLAWGADTITFTALDKTAPLEDTFQLDPKPYNYYSGPVTSETHIQNVINDNVPRVLTGAATLTFGYFGGTPELYTPASTGWVLNYDDTPAAPVSTLLTAVADQIGWTVRYKWYDPLQEYRLTYYAPPRQKTVEFSSIFADADGYTTVVTRTPHGLTSGQAITIAGTGFYNGDTVVTDIFAYNRFRTLQIAGAAAETAGSFTYGPHLTLSDEQVTAYEPLRKNARDIRNAAIVKYNRVPGETATLPVTAVSGGSGSPIQVQVVTNTASYSRTITQLQVGQLFEVFGCPDANANVKDTIASISNGTIVGSVNIGAALSATSAGFKSEYLRYKTAFSVATTSIAKYGLRQAAVYEASNGNINTAAEALKLAQAIVSDLAEPTADISARIHCAPWMELHDLVTLSPDKRQRWTSALDTAVVGVQHHFEGPASYTNLMLRSATSSTVSGGAPTGVSPTLGTGWVHRNIVSPLRPAITDTMETRMDDISLLGASLGGKVGRQFTWGIKPAFHQSIQGRRGMRSDVMEIHMSTDSAFIPDATTLVDASRGGGG